MRAKIEKEGKGLLSQPLVGKRMEYNRLFSYPHTMRNRALAKL